MSDLREISAGAVVYKIEYGEIKIALTFRSNRSGWYLPKGKIEEGEVLEDTAKREVLEETGLCGILEDKIGDIHYTFFKSDKNSVCSKTVTFFLYKYSYENVIIEDKLVEDVRWFSVDDALSNMMHIKEKEMVIAARDILLKRSS